MPGIGLLLNGFYLLLILAGLPWFLWAAWRKGKYREGYAEKLLGRVPPRTGNRTCVWLHAVSVGEVNLLQPLLRAIAGRRPDCECVISTTTLTGIELARKKYPEHNVFYCPLDFTWAVAEAMRRVRPNVLVLTELELWPNLILAAHRRGARVAVINGRLSEHSFRGYRRIRFLLCRVFEHIELVAVQDATYAERFLALGARPETVHVTGSMKYDGARTDRNNPATRRLAELAGFAPDDVVFLAGSTQEGEEQAALEAFRELAPHYPRLRLVLVPRHPDRFDAVGRLLDQSGTEWIRRSQLTETADSDNPSSARVLLVDTVGELGAWWGTAHIAFVGGSLGSRGGQNMIEPAAYGAAVSFGPNTRNFRDIVAALLARDAAVVVANRTELTAFVRRCLEEPAWAAEVGRRAQEHVRQQLGATERTVELLEPRERAKGQEPITHNR
ncbi:MAG: 3-deoxy-D-manno-octulosonic acid transferase [Thermoguttaceae bacterium]|jgi:3-deoxy-D-manno-octulosonic-acid transferase|nr:3-deoxy-D-manno-octulosonic acid transferase [Thermoguttaceae bacterium]